MKVQKHILVDITPSDISKSLQDKLIINCLYDYKDTVLKEHIYSEPACLLDRAQSAGIPFTKSEQKEIQKLSREMMIHKAAYFRIIY